MDGPAHVPQVTPSAALGPLLDSLVRIIAMSEAVGMVVFACIVLGFVLAFAQSLFAPRHARRHRLTGVVYFALLFVGAVDASRRVVGYGGQLGLTYDVCLGIAGILIAVTAALDFGYAHDERRFVKNKASGTLEDTATVTRAEMWEHSFYQLLLLAQILYIHGISWMTKEDPNDLASRLVGLLLVTSPWFFRYLVPVNSFSKNYNDDQSAWTVYGVLYRIKKWQYVFLKHVLIHGLNITLAVQGDANLAHDAAFRFYWIAVNWSYTMEFFLQTLVKKKKMEQSTLLALQKLLMGVGSLAGIAVVPKVMPVAAAVSCFLNFTNRGKEMTNTTLATVAALGAAHLQRAHQAH